ncbi:MAG: hypothetical protein O3C43_09525 [Verrucomicrobia bacterium]|nr:hypothetical protein [Verrucomicrobiota bacterium]MDA1066729.1 hypothetical protein [Verrucomicrobiota bacterium]
MVGFDISELQEVDGICRTVIAGCALVFDWPEKFPERILVQLAESGVPQVSKSSKGNVSLRLINGSPQNEKAEWLARVLLTRYALWKGNETPPPLWLVNTILIEGSSDGSPQLLTLIKRRLIDQAIPTMAQKIQTYDRTMDIGWDFLIFRFLKSGGLEQEVFQTRLLQFWSNGYDWTQLQLFFTPRFPGLNGAELELLWKTFVDETLSIESAVCWTESHSLKALEDLVTMEVTQNNQLKILSLDTWFLYRSFSFVSSLFKDKQMELELMAISIHPYYFNACHSLNNVLIAIMEDDLSGYQTAVHQWNQDMLDAQQLSFETDRILKLICP